MANAFFVYSVAKPADTKCASDQVVADFATGLQGLQTGIFLHIYRIDTVCGHVPRFLSLASGKSQCLFQKK